MTGWFPRFSPSGVLTAEHPGHWRAQWIRDGQVIFDNGAVLVINGTPTEYQTCNELSASGGRWAAMRTDPVRIYTSDGQRVLGAGCPAITGSRFAYVNPRQADVKGLFLDGVEVQRGAIFEVHLSEQALVWKNGGRTWGLRFDNGQLEDIQAAPDEFRPIPIDTPDGPWVLNHTDTGIILRPFGSFMGYRFDNGGQTYYPDGLYQDGAIRVAFSDERGVISIQPFPVNAPRVDLRVPGSKPVIERLPGPVVYKEPDMQPKPLLADIHAIVVELHARNLKLAHGSDNDRRVLQKMICQTVCARKGSRFGWKSNHLIAGDDDNAKDALAELPEGDTVKPNQRQPLYIWDLFNGTTRAPNPLPLMSGPEHESAQYFVPVEPLDHLAGVVPAPDPVNPPPPVDSAELAQLRAENARLKEDLVTAVLARQSLERQVADLMAQAQTRPTYDETLDMIRQADAAFQAALGRKKRSLDPASCAHLVWGYLLEGRSIAAILEDARGRA